MTNQEINNRLDQLEKMTKIQCSDGNWNYDAYMHGLANGMIYAQAILQDINPIFLDAPSKWLADDILLPTKSEPEDET